MTNTINIARPEMLATADVWACFRLATDGEGATSNAEIIAVADTAIAFLAPRAIQARWVAAWRALRAAV